MRALVTNDDGIDSPGLATLAAVAVEAGLEVIAAAPSWDSSGASASLTAVEVDGRVMVGPRDLGLEGVVAYGVEAAPAFIVRAAIHEAFGEPPDLVLSGVNLGANTGRAVLHSGTVGAALTGTAFGRPAAAFSVAASSDFRWDTAAIVARQVVQWLVGAGRAVTLNVNVPNVAPSELAGMRRATLSSGGVVQATVTERGQGFVALEYGPPLPSHEPGSDGAVLTDGFASVTPILAACEAGGEAIDDLLLSATTAR
jgi:5'-nucleotidase